MVARRGPSGPQIDIAHVTAASEPLARGGLPIFCPPVSSISGAVELSAVDETDDTMSLEIGREREQSNYSVMLVNIEI